MIMNARPIITLGNQEQICPRWGHSICAVGNFILIFGGYENSKYHNDLWKFDLKSLQFTQIEAVGDIPPPCSNFTMNVDTKNERVILFGGGTNNKEKFNSVYELNIKNMEWKQLKCSESMPVPSQRSYHCAQLISNYLVVFGGQFLDDMNDLWIFDLSSCQWEEIKFKENNVKPIARKFSASFAYKNRMYILGGCHQKYQCLGDAYYIDFTAFLTSKNTQDLEWQQVTLKNSELINRWGHTVVVKQHQAYLFGGRSNNVDLQNLVEIDLINQICITHKIVAKGRRKPGLCLMNDTIFCMSGFDGSYVKDFFYIPLHQKPNYLKISSNDLNKRGKLQAELLDPQSKDSLTFSNSSISLSQQKQYQKSIKTSIVVPLKVRQLPFDLCAEKLATRGRFFNILTTKSTDEELLVHQPANITPYEYQNLVELFGYYLMLGRIVLTQEVAGSQIKYLNYLLELADYYCIDHLQELVEVHLLNLLEASLNSENIAVSQIIWQAYTLANISNKCKDYVGYLVIHKILQCSHAGSIKQLDSLFTFLKNEREKDWMIGELEKYQFQVQQQILSGSQDCKENSSPSPARYAGGKSLSPHLHKGQIRWA